MTPPRPPVHELAILAAFLCSLAAVVAVAIAEGPEAVADVGLRELALGLAFALGAVTVPRKPPRP